MSPRFYNADGSLTNYSLICGYIEQHNVKEYTVTLSFEPDCCYDVKILFQKKRIYWLQRSSLGEARKLVSKLKGIIRRNQDLPKCVAEIEDKYSEG